MSRQGWGQRKRMNLNTKGEVSTTVLAFRTCIGLWHSFHIPRQMLSSTDIFPVYHTSSIPATAHHAEGLCGAEVSTETRATKVIPVPSSQISLWVLRCQITGRFILLAPLEKLWMHPPLSVALPFKKLLGTLYLWDSLCLLNMSKHWQDHTKEPEGMSQVKLQTRNRTSCPSICSSIINFWSQQRCTQTKSVD